MDYDLGFSEKIDVKLKRASFERQNLETVFLEKEREREHTFEILVRNLQVKTALFGW